MKIADLVKMFGSYRMEKGGDELVFKCPKCRRRKFYVNPAKLKSHCVVCSWVVKFPRAVKKFIAPKRAVKKVEDKPVVIPGFNSASRHITWDANHMLMKRGFESYDWFTHGWGMSDKYPNRIIIPIVENGKVMSWVARAIDGSNPKEISGPNRHNFLYGYDLNPPDRLLNIILVEGIFDQIKINSFCWPCLALMGSSISDIQIGKLLKLEPAKVILMLDGDDAGRKATETIANRLGKRMNPMRISKVYLPEGKDPDELTREEFNKLMEGL